MQIIKATRYPIKEAHDTLEFEKGVNVIVGEMNAGKTKWLQMIDFTLGDTGQPEEAFDKEIAEKYDKIVLRIVIDKEEFNIERRWKEAGSKAKIFINDEGMTSKQFSEFMLSKLNIPIIHMPSGNPYSDRTWPELSWREMFRHMYKQERFWSDFTQKQLDNVRSACILNFLNAANSLYPKEYGDLISKKKEKDRLVAQKDVFVRVLQDFAVEIVGQPEMTVAVTPDSIKESRQRLGARLGEIDVLKAAVLKKYDQQAEAAIPEFKTAKTNLEFLHQTLRKVETECNESISRHRELIEYAGTLEMELARFDKIKTGVSVFADLKVTHCPVCDQQVLTQRQKSGHCHLCGQIRTEDEKDDIVAGKRRIEFEEQQITEELNELRKLIKELEIELRAYDVQISEISQQIQTEKRAINSAEALSIRAIPPELALFDHEAGLIMSQLQQLDRIERSIKSREELNTNIMLLEDEIKKIDAEIKKVMPAINFEELGDLLSDRMNSYLNQVNADGLSRWKNGRASIILRKDAFDLFLDGQKWTTRAGGTANYIIQIAYHYALFSLSKNSEYNYPGFLIIDFPPHFAKAKKVRDSENYLLKPFVDLCSEKEMLGTQVIIAGRAFEMLKGAKTIQL